jgi:hypothetical protein
MTPHPRTSQLRDRRFARVRRITQTVLIGSGLTSGAFIGYAAATAKPLPVVTLPTHATSSTTTTTTLAPIPSGEGEGDDTNSQGVTGGSTATAPPTTAPHTSTTTCYSTPSGQTVCY